jgi:cellulose synthase/poly-beta-1,6-N-acetylglucosamine synthase-like glycosyltransferase
MFSIIFWISFSLLIYTYIGYGLIIFALAKFFNQPSQKGDFKAPLTVLIIAHNEEKTIGDRINNILKQEYPKDLLRVMVVSDGSSDQTSAIVERFKDQGVKLINIERRRGKAAALNYAIPLVDTEFVVLADSRQRFAKDAIKELMKNFSDKRIGVASGELCFKEGRKTGAAEGIDFYWKYEKFLRKAESKIDSTCGTTGAIYAIRKDLFIPIPSDTLLDDVIIPMDIVMQGLRCVFEPKAIAYDYVATTPQEEARRKIRTIAGNFQMFLAHKYLLNPFKNRIFFQTFSHKFLRIIAPLFIVALFASNLFILHHLFFRVIFILQAVFYSFATLGWILRAKTTKLKLFTVPYAFVTLNLITVKAFIKFSFSKPENIWVSKKKHSKKPIVYNREKEYV